MMSESDHGLEGGILTNAQNSSATYISRHRSDLMVVMESVGRLDIVGRQPN